jgi:hypothetical protein
MTISYPVAYTAEETEIVIYIEKEKINLFDYALLTLQYQKCGRPTTTLTLT